MHMPDMADINLSPNSKFESRGMNDADAASTLRVSRELLEARSFRREAERRYGTHEFHCHSFYLAIPCRHLEAERDARHSHNSVLNTQRAEAARIAEERTAARRKALEDDLMQHVEQKAKEASEIIESHEGMDVPSMDDILARVAAAMEADCSPHIFGLPLSKEDTPQVLSAAVEWLEHPAVLHAAHAAWVEPAPRSSQVGQAWMHGGGEPWDAEGEALCRWVIQ